MGERHLPNPENLSPIIVPLSCLFFWWSNRDVGVFSFFIECRGLMTGCYFFFLLGEQQENLDWLDALSSGRPNSLESFVAIWHFDTHTHKSHIRNCSWKLSQSVSWPCKINIHFALGLALFLLLRNKAQLSIVNQLDTNQQWQSNNCVWVAECQTVNSWEMKRRLSEQLFFKIDFFIC